MHENDDLPVLLGREAQSWVYSYLCTETFSKGEIYESPVAGLFRKSLTSRFISLVQ